jgi:hypothetical protein
LRAVGYKPKDLLGIPWMVAFALRADGWYLRSDIIWAKPNPMPESVTDRPTKAHEYLFLLSKSARYFYDADAVREDARSGESRHGRRADDALPARRTGEGPRLRWRSAQGRRAVPGPQQTLRLDRRNAALPRRTLRHLPAEADRAVCAGRVQPAGLR